MQAARTAGMSTATIGKLGPVLIFDHTERSGELTIVVDGKTGRSRKRPTTWSSGSILRGTSVLSVAVSERSFVSPM
jgi:hypothetical protein